jgi:hypothetical protein
VTFSAEVIEDNSSSVTNHAGCEMPPNGKNAARSRAPDVMTVTT